MASLKAFQLTAARRRLAQLNHALFVPDMFQLTAARRRLVMPDGEKAGSDWVSTHSRPKAAGCSLFPDILACQSFNSQPPEGGW